MFFFFFLLQGLGLVVSLVMLSNALFCSLSTSSTSGQNMAWKKKRCFEQKTALIADGGKAIKTQFSGTFFLGFSLIQKNWKMFCLFVDIQETLPFFLVDRNEMLLSIDQNRKPFLFSLSFCVLHQAELFLWEFHTLLPLSTHSYLQRGFSCPT